MVSRFILSLRKHLDILIYSCVCHFFFFSLGYLQTSHQRCSWLKHHKRHFAAWMVILLNVLMMKMKIMWHVSLKSQKVKVAFHPSEIFSTTSCNSAILLNFECELPCEILLNLEASSASCDLRFNHAEHRLYFWLRSSLHFTTIQKITHRDNISFRAK